MRHACCGLLVLLCVVPAQAQSLQEAGRLVREVVSDPTTYAPAGMLYTSAELDWHSSQPLFDVGFVEDNPRFTVNGLPHDMPVSNGEGQRRIVEDALATLPAMFAYNAASRLSERALVSWWPQHEKLIHVLGWVERITVSAWLSYRLSAEHFRQWQRNQALLGRTTTR